MDIPRISFYESAFCVCYAAFRSFSRGGAREMIVVYEVVIGNGVILMMGGRRNELMGGKWLGGAIVVFVVGNKSSMVLVFACHFGYLRK